MIAAMFRRTLRRAAACAALLLLPAGAALAQDCAATLRPQAQDQVMQAIMMLHSGLADAETTKWIHEFGPRVFSIAQKLAAPAPAAECEPLAQSLSASRAEIEPVLARLAVLCRERLPALEREARAAALAGARAAPEDNRWLGLVGTIAGRDDGLAGVVRFTRDTPDLHCLESHAFYINVGQWVQFLKTTPPGTTAGSPRRWAP